MDNGFLKLENVRIPRNQLLMKYAKVHPDGTYEKPPHEKLAYGTMIFVRADLVSSSALHLSRGVTIAIRYSTIRKQGSLVSKTFEHALLDYKTQKYRLVTLLSISYALHFAGQYMRVLYNQLNEEMKAGNFDHLPELHATSAGLKAVSTSLAAEGIEECRKCCGGHGYSQFSGFTQLYSDVVAACTYEGDNIVLLQQTARRLFKLIKTQKGFSGNVAYLRKMKNLKSRCKVKEAKGFLDPLYQQAILVRWPQKLISETSKRLMVRMNSGEQFGEAWNALQVPLCKMAEAHCYYIMGVGFIKAVAEAHVSVKPILKKLSDLFILTTIYRNRADYLDDGFFQGIHISLLEQQIDQLIVELADQAVPLVDAFNFSDKFLNSSALGRYDGNVYEGTTIFFVWISFSSSFLSIDQSSQTRTVESKRCE